MIKTVKNKALKRYIEKADASKLPAHYLDKITDVLTMLDAAVNHEDMNFPGSRLHKLSGDLKNFWSVSVSANWRIIFRFENGDAYDVDYIDYH